MLELLKKYSGIIKNFKVSKFEQFGTNLRLRINIEFIDQSKLYVRETIIKGEKRKYSYHWQREDQIRFMRWDNAPDWDVETFPHHKHENNKVLPSYERTLDQVLNYINSRIMKAD